MDSASIIGIIISILFIIQGLINTRYNNHILFLLDRVDTLEQLHWARTNPIHIAEAEPQRQVEPEPVEDPTSEREGRLAPECGRTTNI
jgi:hypothetical protein